MNLEPKFQIYLTQNELRKILWLLLGLDIFLLLMYLIIFVFAPDFQWGPIDHYFDFDDDMSLPSWYASVQYLLIAIPTLITAYHSNPKKMISKKFLYFMGMISVFLALDEAVGIHEQITVVVNKLDIQWLKSFAFDGSHGIWISVYALIGIILTLSVFRGLLSIWTSFRTEALYIIMGGALLVMGEVGFEVISYLFLRSEPSGLLYNLEVATEEFFAIVGVSFIMYGVFLFLAKIQSAGLSEK
jgi:hypothetical protein